MVICVSFIHQLRFYGEDQVERSGLFLFVFWVGTGSVGRNWFRIGSELVPNWVGTGSDR